MRSTETPWCGSMRCAVKCAGSAACAGRGSRPGYGRSPRACYGPCRAKGSRWSATRVRWSSARSSPAARRTTCSLGGGERRSRFELGWARHLLSDEDGALIAVGPGGAAMRLDGRKRWSIDGAGDASAAGVLRRGVLLLQRGPTELYDAADGLLVAQLPAARAAALGADLCCALLHEDAVSLHKLATHLSVV